ncbi:hypothetical protein Fcan01_10252 [Folsomia candida]|uniref:Ionotropic glutamate receptor C-terminal domain-containing protein n=1 Tax=Folsomia candida TaxID=158441 RepID=A0A226EBH6_FOLCA|nr:hypothetical protein Fcan01_10252 [Folsomia candida]
MPPILFVIVTYFAIILSTQIKSTEATDFWSVPDVFSSCTIQFITGGCSQVIDSEELLRSDIRTNNPYTPTISDLIPGWDLSKTRYSSDHLFPNSHLLSDLTRKRKSLSANTVVTFVNQKCGKENMHKYSGSQRLLFWRIVLSHENPDFIFNHVYFYSRRLFPKCFLTSIFLDFDYDMPNHLGMYFCESLISLELTALNEISQTWKNYHTNLQKQIVVMSDRMFTRSLKANCGGSLLTYALPIHYHACGLLVIAKKYNFTLTQSFPGISPRRHAGNVNFFVASNNYSLYNWICRVHGKEISTYGVEFMKFAFAIITPKPSTMEGFETLYAPFDSVTWGLLISSCIALLLVMSLQSEMDSPIELVKSVWNKIYWIVSTLLVESDGIGLISTRKTVVLFPWLICWYFCCMLISNFYQGEVYSSLTKISIPALPRTMHDLIDSGIPIITHSEMGAQRNNSESYLSNLEYQIELILDAFEEQGAAAKYLVKLMKRISHVSALNDVYLLHISRNISFSTELYDHHGKIVETAGSIAIVDHEEEVEKMADHIELFDNKSITRNYEDINLRYVLYSTITRNNIFQLVHYALGQFQQAGISQRWKALLEMRVLHFEADFLLGTSNSRYFRKKRENAKSDVVFNEAQAVSVGAIEYLVVGCTVLSVLAGMAFAIEIRDTIAAVMRNSWFSVSRRILKVLTEWRKYIGRVKCKCGSCKLERYRAFHESKNG